MKLKNKMRKIPKNSLLLLLLMFIPLYVLADGAAPTLVSIDVVVSNTNGAVCYDSKYENEKTTYVKTETIIPFGETLQIQSEFGDKYTYVVYEKNNDYESCLLQNTDLKLKKDSFSVDDAQVSKLQPVNGVIFASSLNMRKGPSTSYSKITAIPKGSVVTLTHRAGTYWFYAEYNGKKGWISAENNYLGYNNAEILISTRDTTIYDKNYKEIGKIPALTEITDYVQLASFEGLVYYVNYNGIKGYVYNLETKCSGKINVLKDTNLYRNDKVIKTIKNGTVLEYSIMVEDYPEEFYIPKENGVLRFENNDYKIIGETTYPKKTSGYIGEGLFGEQKNDKISGTGKSYEVLEESTNNSNNNDNPINEPQTKPQNNPESNTPSKEKFTMSSELIIICVLGSIVLALTVIIIIMLVNRKKRIVKIDMIKVEKGDKNVKKEESSENK